MEYLLFFWRGVGHHLAPTLVGEETARASLTTLQAGLELSGVIVC